MTAFGEPVDIKEPEKSEVLEEKDYMKSPNQQAKEAKRRWKEKPLSKGHCRLTLRVA